MHMSSALMHGGPDAQGIPLHDFSTNANACGPCPAVLQAMARAPAHTYPDPHYTALRARLAQWHGVDAARIVIGASASELIFRITAAMVRSAMQVGARATPSHASQPHASPLRARLAHVSLPRHGYGDYRRAAEGWGLPVAYWGAAHRDAACGDEVDDDSNANDNDNGNGNGNGNGEGEGDGDANGSAGSAPTRAASRATQTIPRDPSGQHGIHLIWLTEPASPLGDTPAEWHALLKQATRPGCVLVVDRAYAPLRLTGTDPLDAHSQARHLRDHVWQLFSPNKALGLTGVRGAYLIAPFLAPGENPDTGIHSPPNILQATPNILWEHLHALAPSWPLGAHAEAMLMAWPTPDVQQWLKNCLPTLRDWKMQLEAGLQARGWHVHPGCSTFCCARPPHSTAAAFVSRLRQHGIKLRDATPFGLPGWFRLGVRPPASQQALWKALDGGWGECGGCGTGTNP